MRPRLFSKKTISALRRTLAMLLFTVLPFMTSADELLETKVKSAYLYHLVNYVDWAELPSDAFHICVLGADTMGGMLHELANRKVKNLPLQINVDDIENPATCQVLFIGQTVKNWQNIVNKLQGTSVLTVSDAESFVERGGMVGFYSLEGKTKLQLNPNTTKAANLKISVKLMEIARIVSLP